MKSVLFILFMFSFSFCAENQLTVHYHRNDNNYSGWGLHLWGGVEEADGSFIVDGVSYNWQNPLLFSESDDYGAKVTFSVSDDSTPLGFIVHKGDNKDPDGDRFFSEYDQTNEIWLLSGVNDIFFENPGTEARMMSAKSDGESNIFITMTSNISDYQDRFEIFKNDESEEVVSISMQDRIITLALENPIDITALYEVLDTSDDNQITVNHAFSVDDYVYDGGDLGFSYLPQATTFKLWSPTASAVEVLIYTTPQDDDYSAYPMTKEENGVLTATVAGDLKNNYYLYRITMAGETYTTQDPYSRAMSTNSAFSLIYDVEDTYPEQWQTDSSPVLQNPEDAVIYEVHIRDLSIDESWNGSEEKRGKYLGMREDGTQYNGISSGFSHIKDLGVNVVQILPMYDFASVDETDPLSRNWGYDPNSYNTPEGGYSSNPDDISRIKELKSMIKGFHDAGIKVVMDVVYNHTYQIGENSLFDQTVPGYYYQLDENGGYLNYSGCGNVVDTDKPMVRNFIMQSVKHWVEEYHIDGFRFDLMGLIETDLMEELTNSLKEIKPDILVYGEPWGGWGAPILTGKGDQRSKGFAAFNDNIRNAVRGDTDGLTAGYAMGNTESVAILKKGICGSIDDFTDDPSETINYISAHDNYTWFDKLERTMESSSAEERKEMNKLGAAIILTSQGIPFLHAGSEFLRTKRAPGATEEQVRNSYNANDQVNKLDWKRKSNNMDIYNYYKGLIALRKGRAEFRMTDADMIRNNLHFFGNNPNNIAFKLKDITPTDNWGDILVIYNPNSNEQSFQIPQGRWVVVADDDEAGLEMVKTGVSQFSEGMASVAAYSCMVLYNPVDPGLKLNYFQNSIMDQYLHFAVNVSYEEEEEVALWLDDEQIVLNNIAEKSWTGYYKMEEAGTHQILLTYGDKETRRYFAVGEADKNGGVATSSDRIATLLLKAECFENRVFIPVFDAGSKDSIGDGEYQFGYGSTELKVPAEISFNTRGKKGTVYRKEGENWLAIPSFMVGDRVVAKTRKLGTFKIGKAIYDEMKTDLLGNYPNPFNPSTTIAFNIGDQWDGQGISLNIYNIKGQLVRRLLNKPLKRGHYKVNWNGLNDYNSAVTSGVYLYRLKSGKQIMKGKMILTR